MFLNQDSEWNIGYSCVQTNSHFSALWKKNADMSNFFMNLKEEVINFKHTAKNKFHSWRQYIEVKLSEDNILKFYENTVNRDHYLSALSISASSMSLFNRNKEKFLN